MNQRVHGPLAKHRRVLSVGRLCLISFPHKLQRVFHKSLEHIFAGLMAHMLVGNFSRNRVNYT